MNDIVKALGELARHEADATTLAGHGIRGTRLWNELALACEQYIAERAPVRHGGAVDDTEVPR